MMNFNMQIISVILIQLTCIFSAISANIFLEKISTLYIPLGYKDGEPIYKFDSGAAEQSSFDHEQKIIYIVGHNNIHIIDVADVTSPTIVYNQTFGNYDATDVEFCGGYAFVALDNLENKEQGEVRVFHRFDKNSGRLVELHRIIVGSLPDMVKPTSDCRTVLVAIEAEVYAKNNKLVDPEGGVGMIKFDSDDLSKNYTYKVLDFRRYNNKWYDLTSRGARFIYRHNNNTFAQDIEPEYIAYNDDYSKAYICLQENNAIAVVDMASTQIIGIYPLGYKYWGNLSMDASDADNKINLKSWPVYGMYQPDSIHVINVRGVSYVVTANEGDVKDYSDKVTGAFNEEARVKDLIISADSPIKTWADKNNMTIHDLQQKSNLGRLKVTTENGGHPNSYEYKELYAFGARSFSIWRADTMELVYDSGSDIEEKMSKSLYELFNGDPDGTETVSQSWDKRSDDKGPETEGLAVAHIRGKVIIFVGNERPGTISIYSIEGNVNAPKYESIWSGVTNYSETWNELYKRRELSEVDPEDLRYIPPEYSPNGEPMLIASSAVSGTVSLFTIKGLPPDSEDENIVKTTPISGSNRIDSSVHVLLVLIIFQILSYSRRLQ